MGLLDRLRPRRAPAQTVILHIGTRVGTDDGFRAVVDDAAAVHLLDRPVWVGWWIGGDDRWYDPAAERAVRQVRPGPAPVLETRLRVAGGDVVATTWAAVAGGPGVVVELANETPVPVAVAVVAGSGGQVAVEDRTLSVDGAAACTVDREPGRFALADTSAALWAAVTGGAASESVPPPLASPTGDATGALVVPLLHHQSLRFVVPGGDPARLPAADRVAAGWSTRLEGAARIELPDESLQASVSAGLVDLLLAEPVPDVAAQLASWGLVAEAVERIAAHHGEDSAGWLRATATCWVLHRRPEPFADLPLGDLVAAARSEPGAVARLAGLFAARGDDRAATDAASLAGSLAGSLAEPEGPLWDLARRLARPVDGGLALLGEVPESWYGQPVEVHDLPTVHGSLSYGVRWHGERPALLWEFEPHDDGPVRLTVPGLDPAFSTTEPTGEALLAAPRGAAPVSPPEPGSFS